MKKRRDIVEEIEDELNADIYSAVLLANNTDEELLNALDEGFSKAYTGT